MCMERVKWNQELCELYCCPITWILLYALFTYISLISYQLDSGENTAFPEGPAKTPVFHQNW